MNYSPLIDFHFHPITNTQKIKEYAQPDKTNCEQNNLFTYLNERERRQAWAKNMLTGAAGGI